MYNGIWWTQGTRCNKPYTDSNKYRLMRRLKRIARANMQQGYNARCSIAIIDCDKSACEWDIEQTFVNGKWQ